MVSFSHKCKETQVQLSLKLAFLDRLEDYPLCQKDIESIVRLLDKHITYEHDLEVIWLIYLLVKTGNLEIGNKLLDARTLKEDIKTFKEESFASIVSSRNPYAFHSDFVETENLDKTCKMLGVEGGKRIYKHIPISALGRGVDELQQYKIFISKADIDVFP